jgi:hypothetical protein
MVYQQLSGRRRARGVLYEGRQALADERFSVDSDVFQASPRPASMARRRSGSALAEPSSRVVQRAVRN